MYKYVLKRLLLLIPIMIAVSFIVYFFIDLAPGDIVDVIAGQQVSVEEKEMMREEMGLNDPLIIRYFRYMGGLLRGDLGMSYVTNRDVFEVYISRLPATLKLAIASTLISLLIGIPLGINASVHQNTWVDSTSTVLGLIGISIPIFWLGLMLIILFALKLGWFPSIGNDSPLSIVLPAITVGSSQAALILRTTRSSMLEVIRQDYLRTARAKGVTEKIVILKHAFKNALIPILTVIGTQFGISLGGAVVTETIFAWPGVGRLMVDSINNRDNQMLTGAIILTTMLSSIVILMIDLAYSFVDPRIKARYSK
ncbi:MAG TPA: ABC transporter permease [Sedimentibacter sp.]|jgi:peptide/nickel transport system permease protein|nr:peptide ABC transporter permease [Clostridiales bacterium]HPY56411.1 ABC transporter permease [Sedimentibacter sp.]